MGDIFDGAEFSEDGTPLLSRAQSERFVELLKRAFDLPPATFLCMKCGDELVELGEDENGLPRHEPCGCGLPDPEGPLRFG